MVPPAELVSPPEDPPVDGCRVEVCDPQAIDIERMANTANPVGSNFRMGTSSFEMWQVRLLFLSLAVADVWQRHFKSDR
jgi:hypothetical protein